VSPERSFVEVVAGGLSVLEIVTPCSPRLDLLAAGSGVSHMAGLSRRDLARIAEGLELLELDYAHLLVDSAAGVSEQTVRFAACCDLVLVVTTPDVTAMTDAYAFLKVLSRARPATRPLLVVNRARGAPEAEAVARRMQGVSHKFLGLAPRWIGWVPEDEVVPAAVNARAPVVAFAPQTLAARALAGVAASVVEELVRLHPCGMGRLLLGDAPRTMRRH
jgi:flagellar biosynthesis protein FlhG